MVEREGGPLLVTGATGFIGRHLVPLLLEAGYPVRCLVREQSRKRGQRYLPVEAEVVEGDLYDAAGVRSAVEGCGGVLHLASPSAWDLLGDPIVEDKILEGVRNVFESASGCGVRRLLFVSSLAALGPSRENPVTESQPTPIPRGLYYAHGKRKAEDWLREAAETAGMETVVIYPGEVYGPGDDDFVTAANLVRLLQQRPRLVPDGGTAIVHVEDVARGIVAAWTKAPAGSSYLFAGDNLRLKELGDRTLRAAGKRGHYGVLPWVLLAVPVWLERALGLRLGLDAPVLEYARYRWFADGEKAREELGLTFRNADGILEPTLRWLLRRYESGMEGGS